MKIIAIHTSILLACLCARADAPAQNEALDGVQIQIEQAREQAAEAARAAGQALDEAKIEVKRAVGEVKQKVLELAQNGVSELDLDARVLPFEAALNAFETQFKAVTAPSRTSAKPLIIRSGTADAASLSALQEDLAVMTRVLNKAVGGKAAHAGQDWALGIAVSTLGERQRPQSLYLDGYGAVFFLNVNFPLVPPPNKDNADNEKPVDPDSEWERAKEELQGGGGKVTLWDLRPGKSATARVPFEAERVDSLKRKLIKVLKNASNIRHLKPDEWITVAVTGGASGAAVEIRGKAIAMTAAPYVSRAPGTELDPNGEGDEPEELPKNLPKKKKAPDVFIWNTDRSQSGEGSTLTLRVRKADVDVLAAGKFTAEEFEEKVAVAVY